MRASSLIVMGVASLLAGGCHYRDSSFEPADSYVPLVQDIEYPDAVQCDTDLAFDALSAPPSVRHPEDLEKWPLSLEEVMQLALANSQVIRDIGGRVVNAPGTSATIYDPAIREADPRVGVEAALSAFDAQLSGRLFIEQTDRAFNNRFFGSGTNALLANLADVNVGIGKTAASGTQFLLENQTNYNRNNAEPNLFGSAYDTVYTASIRHPLMQGGGVEFNRIAGPLASAGNYNGVLIARINSDISLADFEAAVRDLLRDVQATYWELYFAYRDFDAKGIGRQLALESWQLEKRRADAGVRTADQEAFARQQYYLAQITVENGLSGNANGTGGVYAVESRLRSLLGLPATDGRIIVPSEEPMTVDMRFDWHESLASALTRRVELRRQQWTLKRRKLELVAARNFTKPRVDLVGQYRWRGFGDELFGNRNADSGSAYDTLFDGNLQDWRYGIEVATPIGNRVGHAAARHAELVLAREHALYEEMEREICSQLRAAFTELDRAYVVSRSNYNRRIATFVRLQAERQRNEKGQTDLDLVLDAQQQAVDAESSYYRAVVDYTLALANLHYRRGTLLDHYGVYLSEGAWSAEAHCSAAKRMRQFRLKHMNYCMTNPPPVSVGAYSQPYDLGPDFSEIPAHDEAEANGDTAPLPPVPVPAEP